MKMNDKQWFLLKQQYPIGRKFWAKVGRIKPFGIFVETSDSPKDSSKFIGLIDIGHIALYKEESQELPLNTILLNGLKKARTFIVWLVITASKVNNLA